MNATTVAAHQQGAPLDFDLPTKVGDYFIGAKVMGQRREADGAVFIDEGRIRSFGEAHSIRDDGSTRVVPVALVEFDARTWEGGVSSPACVQAVPLTILIPVA